MILLSLSIIYYTIAYVMLIDILSHACVWSETKH